MISFAGIRIGVAIGITTGFSSYKSRCAPRHFFRVPIANATPIPIPTPIDYCRCSRACQCRPATGPGFMTQQKPVKFWHDTGANCAILRTFRGKAVTEKLSFRILNFVFGLGMIAASILTIRHFFLANYPSSIYQGSFCDINTFFNCDSSAFSIMSQVRDVPLGYFGMIVGALVVLGSVFPSPEFERTNRSIALANFLGVVSLFLFSVLYLKSLCLLCSGYYVFSVASFILFAISRRPEGFFRPSFKHAAAFAAITVAGAYGMTLYHETKREAQTGIAGNIVKQYYSLPRVKLPSVISPYRPVSSAEKFEDAPIQVVEYADFLCPDCLFLSRQMSKLKEEFKGRINIAFQFFPLEAKCNDVVDKDRHPGACELAFIAAKDPSRFPQIHDEIFANFSDAKKPEWRARLAQRYNAEDAPKDRRTAELVQQIIQTGKEYEKTSEKFPFGIRSTPTMIINNRLVIGTLPYAQLRAIFQSLSSERQGSTEEKKFIENWVPTGPKK